MRSEGQNSVIVLSFELKITFLIASCWCITMQMLLRKVDKDCRTTLTDEYAVISKDKTCIKVMPIEVLLAKNIEKTRSGKDNCYLTGTTSSDRMIYFNDFSATSS